jgi:hypothetical protein
MSSCVRRPRFDRPILSVFGPLGDEQAKPAPDHDPGIAGGKTAHVYDFDDIKN